MAIDVVMPQMGESVVEGTVAKWLVKEGDVVREGQPLLEISTDKVDTEIPSPVDGVVAKILVREGETLPVGARLAIIEPKAGVAAIESSVAPEQVPTEAGASYQKGPEVVESHGTEAESGEVAAKIELSGVQKGTTESAAPRKGEISAAVGEEGAPRRWSPVVMKMAAEYGIDLSQIRGTGLGGRVTKRDLEKYLETRGRLSAEAPRSGQVSPSESKEEQTLAAEAEKTSKDVATAFQPSAQPLATPSVFRPPVYQPQAGDIVEPFSRRRKIIAEHMVYSKTHAPHVGIVARVDMTKAVKFRDAHKESFRAREGFPLTFLPLVAMAAVRALKEFPRLNASVVGDSLVIRKQINLGIAVDSEEGLVVPVVKEADQKSLLGLARAIEELRRKTVEGRLTPDDLAGGSFTVSNPGREGNLFGFAIINQPQVAILRMGEVRKEPLVVEVDGEDVIAIRNVMYLTCSYDHRVIDGVLGNRFLHRVAQILEEADFEL